MLSAVLSAFDVSVTHEVAETARRPRSTPTDQIGSAEPEGRTWRPTRAPVQEHVEIQTETDEIESLLSADGIRFLFTSFVDNFAGFSVVAVIFVAMLGVGRRRGGRADGRADPASW